MTDTNFRLGRRHVFIREPETEPLKARLWRERLGLSRGKLASLTGFSVAQVARFERGEGSREGWQKYRMSCAAVDAGWTTWHWQRSEGP